MCCVQFVSGFSPLASVATHCLLIPILDASRAVGPGDILATLNDIRGNLDDIRRNLDNMQRNSTETLEQIQAIMQRNQAMFANIRLARQNHMVPRDRDNYTPLQKTVSHSISISFLDLKVSIQTSGHGRNLAVQASRKEHFNQIPPSATIQVAEVGTCPPFWNPIVDQYTMRTIFQLIIFYNDDFDIQPADNVEVRKYKFRRWLCSVSLVVYMQYPTHDFLRLTRCH